MRTEVSVGKDLAEGDNRIFFSRKLWVIGVWGEDVETFPKDTMGFRETGIGGDKVAGVGSYVAWVELVARGWLFLLWLFLIF